MTALSPPRPVPRCYQWGINSPGNAVQGPFCHTQLVNSVTLPDSTTASQDFFKEA